VTVDYPREAGAQPERGKGRGKLAPAQLFAPTTSTATRPLRRKSSSNSSTSSTRKPRSEGEVRIRVRAGSARLWLRRAAGGAVPGPEARPRISGRL
jgi:hypothetical protein